MTSEYLLVKNDSAACRYSSKCRGLVHPIKQYAMEKQEELRKNSMHFEGCLTVHLYHEIK